MQEQPSSTTPVATFQSGDSEKQAPAVEVHQLTLDYGRRQALRDVSLQIEPGTIFGLLGPNGSGKTSLLSICLGLLSPTSGSLLVQGKRPGQQTRKETGVIFQESCLDPLMTVEETLRLHADMFGLGRAQADSRIAELLERFQLKERSRDQTRILSGGLRRRLELARALLPWPSIILLDEPTSGLDPDARADFWEHAHHVNQEGATLVIATHDMAEAERHCKTVAFMDKGRMVAQGAPSELRRDLKHDSIRLEWPTLRSETLEDIARLPGAGKVTVAPPLLHITVDNARTFLPQLFLLADDGICSIAIRESSLEDAYFQIVGRQAPQ